MDERALDFVKKSKLHFEQQSAEYASFRPRFVFDELKKERRLSILHGLRGSGKTTLLFQLYLASPQKQRIYMHAQEIALVGIPLLDVVEAAAYLFGNDARLFIDEINPLEKWADAIKIAYDKYPNMRFCISGSSSINLLDSKAILARRAGYMQINPLSFREYIWLRYGIMLEPLKLGDDPLTACIRYDLYLGEKMPKRNMVDLFSEYVENNLAYLLGDDGGSLMDLVQKAIFHDIFKTGKFDSSTLGKFERLILLLSASNQVTYDNISKDLGVAKSQVSLMLDFLERAGLVVRVFPAIGGKAASRKEWKYFFTVPQVRKLYAQNLQVPPSRTEGYMLEDIFASNFNGIFFDDVDFVWGEWILELGSYSKGVSQLKEMNTKKKRAVLYKGVDIRKEEGVLKIPLHIFFCVN